MSAPLFKDQAEKWLASGTNRKREPWRETTIATYRSQLENLLPYIGKLPLNDIGNQVLGDVATKLIAKKLEPSTIQHAIDRAKQVRDSYQDAEGQRIYPIEWNNTVIDAPIVDRTKQKTPIASALVLQNAIQASLPVVGSLIAVLAGTGLRIKEALALTVDQESEVGNIWVPTEAKIIVRGQRNKSAFVPTKTVAGVREIDLSPALNDFLKVHIEVLASLNACGYLFPKSESHYRNILDALVPGGFHALRRFRVTYIRLHGVPQPLVDYWTGHGAGTMSEIYTKVGAEIAARREHAERVGLGFELSGTIKNN